MSAVPLRRVAQLLVAAIVLSGTLVLDVASVSVATRSQSQYGASDRGFIGNDFVAFYTAAKFAADGTPERTYDLDALRRAEAEVTGHPDFQVLPMGYPPFFHLVLMPLASVDYVTAYRLWVVGTVALMLMVAWRTSPSWQTLLLTALFPTVSFCIATGQNGNLSAAILGAGLLLLPRRPIAAGIAFGLMAYKPQLALAIPFCLLAGRHYRALAATAATAVGTVAASVLAFGTAAVMAFPANLANMAHGFLSLRDADSVAVWRRMPTVLISVLETTGSETAAWMAHLLVAAAALAAVAWIWRRTACSEVRSLALVAALPLLTPYFFDYDLAIFVVPFALMIQQAGGIGRRADRLVALAALWLAQPLLILLAAFRSDLLPAAPLLWCLMLGHSIRLAANRADRSAARAPAKDPIPLLTSLT